jgi:hypothetical protein
MIKIYGMIGYTILNNSLLFPNTEILLISDMHDEPIKNCYPHKQINIEDLLKKYIDKEYKVLMEEIPDKKELISFYPDSNHINNMRKLYLDNFDKIIAFDIRLDLLEQHKLKYSNIPLITYFTRLFNFFMIKSKIFEEDEIKYYHYELLIGFRDFIKKYINELKKNYYEIDKITFEFMQNDIDKLLSNIIEFYCFCKLFIDLKNNLNKSKKYVINCGLFHSENLINIICKYLKYTKKIQNGINKMEETENNNVDLFVDLCVDSFDF